MPITATRACFFSILLFNSEKCVAEMVSLLIILLVENSRGIAQILACAGFCPSPSQLTGSQNYATIAEIFCHQRITSVTVALNHLAKLHENGHSIKTENRREGTGKDAESSDPTGCFGRIACLPFLHVG